jgi:hypothetical protein
MILVSIQQGARISVLSVSDRLSSERFDAYRLWAPNSSSAITLQGAVPAAERMSEEACRRLIQQMNANTIVPDCWSRYFAGRRHRVAAKDIGWWPT